MDETPESSTAAASAATRNPAFLGALAVAILAVGGAGYYFYGGGRGAVDSADRAASDPGAADRKLASREGAKEGARPADHFAVPGSDDAGAAAAAAKEPLPTLDSSDAALREWLPKILAGAADSGARLEAAVHFQDLIRRLVVAVVNAGEKRQLGAEFSPLKPPAGAFLVAREGDDTIIDPRTYERYAHYAALARDLDVDGIAALYTRLYPLFQSAFTDLGTPGYFNDRVVEVLDRLLATPVPAGPIKVVTQSVAYHFADPELEALPAMGKLLVRMGPLHEAVVLGKLRQLRERLTHLKK